MQRTVNETAKLTGVSIRTLHYYDEIGLLEPDEVTSAGYRFYSDANLQRLQKILFLKELDFSLKEIKEIMDQPRFDTNDILEQHKALLVLKRNRLNKIITLIEDTVKGEQCMCFEAFDKTEIEKLTQTYKEEAKAKWGKHEAYKISEARTSQYKEEEWNKIMEESTRIYKEFVKYMDQDVHIPEVQNIVKAWQDYITKNFYPCTNEILAGLGEMYVADQRFTKNIDQYGEGLASFMAKAIQIYCK
ncbi:MAG: MerR family transcriptional regulator [Cellulosilyticaceae bacterium]